MQFWDLRLTPAINSVLAGFSGANSAHDFTAQTAHLPKLCSFKKSGLQKEGKEKPPFRLMGKVVGLSYQKNLGGLI